ncbi:hypothetical protein KQX54_015845 [Cotesia glomerata]|uniref:Uncharacterized protein n=1 Tax=Cotesia glomerata TaxID=32391 RepID=A0AAV7HX31_COTGL|nr:hypothetical protein KQX54_015845 [Cotesia glomerata]
MKSYGGLGIDISSRSPRSSGTCRFSFGYSWCSCCIADTREQEEAEEEVEVDAEVASAKEYLILNQEQQQHQYQYHQQKQQQQLRKGHQQPAHLGWLVGHWLLSSLSSLPLFTSLVVSLFHLFHS